MAHIHGDVFVSVAIADYTFRGPLRSVDELEDRAGIYAIICVRDQRIFIIDVGESAKVRTAVKHHPQKVRWVEQCHGVIAFAAYYMPDPTRTSTRLTIEHTIRRQYDVW